MTKCKVDTHIPYRAVYRTSLLEKEETLTGTRLKYSPLKIITLFIQLD